MRSSRLGRGRAVGFDANYVAGYQSARAVNTQSLTISGARAKSLGGVAPVAPSPIAPTPTQTPLAGSLDISFGGISGGGLGGFYL